MKREANQRSLLARVADSKAMYKDLAVVLARKTGYSVKEMQQMLSDSLIEVTSRESITQERFVTMMSECTPYVVGEYRADINKVWKKMYAFLESKQLLLMSNGRDLNLYAVKVILADFKEYGLFSRSTQNDKLMAALAGSMKKAESICHGANRYREKIEAMSRLGDTTRRLWNEIIHEK